MAEEFSKPEADAGAAEIPLLRIDAVVKKFGASARWIGCRSISGQGSFSPCSVQAVCGKTTLLRMLAGFETPDQGRDSA